MPRKKSEAMRSPQRYYRSIGSPLARESSVPREGSSQNPAISRPEVSSQNPAISRPEASSQNRLASFGYEASSKSKRTRPGNEIEVEGDKSDSDSEVEEDEAEEDRDDGESVEEAGDRLGLDEAECDDFEAEFAEAREECNVDEEEDSGDDLGDCERIPDPLSSDEDEEDVNDIGERVVPDEKGVFLKLGKTFNSPDEVKIALLRYSLKSQFDIKMYKSEYNHVGGKYSDKRCPWRMYCSYEKRIRKMLVKVFIDTHTCCKSGYTRMLKQRTIAWLFADRLRKNPKLTKYQMADEILREYNLTVSAEQCGKAKAILANERRVSHEAHFDRIWDYQAEVLQSNRGSIFEIETIPGPTIGSKQRFFRLFICFDS